MTRTCFNLTAMLALLFLVLPAWAAPKGSGETELTAVKGNVSLIRGQAAPVLLHKHDTVQAGDEILTDQKSSATVRLPDGSTVHIFPNSHVVLQAETGNWKEFLHVFLGNIRVQVEKLSGRPNPKSVTTPTAIIAVRGTVFAIAVDRNGNTQAGVDEGLVSAGNLEMPGQEVVLKPGQSCWVRRGQPPTAPEMMRQAMPGLMGSGMSNGMGMSNTGSMGMGTPSTGSMGMGSSSPSGAMSGMHR